MQKLLLVVVAVILAAGAFYVYSNFTPAPEPVQQEELQTPSPAASGDAGGVMEDGSFTQAGEDGGPAFKVITYTEAGYEPKSLTVKKGETVRFINDAASQETWPASAVHPTHSIYPEKSASDCLGSSFDACRGLKPGEFWDFTFGNVGEWRFHDHLHASKTGVVVVTE